MQPTMVHGNPTGPYQTLLQPAPFGQGQPMIRSKVIEKFHRGKAIGIGTTLIIAAVIGVIINATDIVYGSGVGRMGHGIWIGAIVIVDGVFGIVAGLRRTRGLIQTFNVLSIVAASLMSLQFFISVTYAVSQSEPYGHRCRYTPIDSDTSIYRDECRYTTAIESTLAALAVIEAILAICGSVMSCKVACCCASCCDNGPIAQTVMINDVPMTVIYQPQNRTVAVSYAAVLVQGAPGAAYQIPNHQAFNVAGPPAYSQVSLQHHQQDAYGAASSSMTCGSAFDHQEVAFNNSGQLQEKHELL